MTTSKDTTADQHALIRAMLVHVPFDGWSVASIEAAAADLGLDGAATQTLLPNGIKSALAGFVDMGDHHMAAAFAELEDKPKGVSATIKTLILLRLDAASPHRQAVTAALKILARPDYAPLATRIFARSIDRMWRLAGDRAVDFSFYSKRAILAGVFASCLAWWVANPSADAARRDAFVSARLKDAAILPKLTAPANKLAKGGVQFVSRVLQQLRPAPPQPSQQQ